MEPQALQQLLSQAFPEDLITIQGDGYHYQLSVVSALFEGKNRLARERLINQVLFPFFQSGELHAVTMKAWTPQEHSSLS